MAADLVRHQVSVIAATGSPAALAAIRPTPIIPIVFETGGDSIKLGLVANLNRPGGNVTGVTQLVQEVEPKLLELLHELLHRSGPHFALCRERRFQAKAGEAIGSEITPISAVGGQGSTGTIDIRHPR